MKKKLLLLLSAVLILTVSIMPTAAESDSEQIGQENSVSITDVLEFGLQETDVKIESEVKNGSQEEIITENEAAQEILVQEERSVKKSAETGVSQGDFTFEINAQTKEATLTAYTGSGTTIVTPQSVTSNGVSYTVTSIGSDTKRFEYGKSVTKVVVSEGVKKIGEYSFANIPHFEAEIEDVKLPSTLESIGRSAFMSQYSLKSITLPVGLKTIEEWAFAFTGLTSVEIPEGVKELKSKILWHCDDLEKITIPASVEKIDRKFSYETYTIYVEIAKGNPYYSSQNNSIIQKKGNMLFLCMTCGENYTTPKGVTAIGPYAFLGAAIRKIIVRDEVTQIGKGAFFGAEAQEIKLSKNLRTIPAELFKYCEELTPLIPNGVKTIGNNAFEGTAGGLVTIPASVKSIGKDVFPPRSNLQFLGKNPPKIKSLLLSRRKTSGNIYVPKGRKAAYEKAFKNKNLKVKEVKTKKLYATAFYKGVNINYIDGANIANYEFKVSGGKYSPFRKITGLKKNKTYTVYARNGKDVIKLRVKTPKK